jgi:hypothetical protein
MTDEVSARRKAKHRDAARDAAIRAALNARAAELQPHAQAILELLHAVGLQVDQTCKTHPKPPRLHIAQFVWLVAVALGVSRAASWKILDRLNSGGDETE